MNTKTRTHRILASSMLVILAIVMVFGIFLANPMEASAATNRAGAYYLYGTYDIGDGSKSGYLSDFKFRFPRSISQMIPQQTEPPSTTTQRITGLISISTFMRPTSTRILRSN